jgi:hypothetical protein
MHLVFFGKMGVTDGAKDSLPLEDNDTKIPYPIKDMILASAVDYGVKVYTKCRTYGFLGSFFLHLFSSGPSKMKTRVFVYRS